MSFLSKNQSCLTKTSTLLAVEHDRFVREADDAVYTQKDGNYLAQRNGVRCFVHSRYNIAEEVESMFATTPRNTECIMLFGCGLGCAVSYALNPQNFPSLKKLIIVEPSPRWIEIVINETDITQTWEPNADKISCFIGYRPDSIGRSIADEINAYKEFYPVYHLSVRTMFAEYYQTLLFCITDQLRSIQMILNTSKKMLHKKTYNEVSNLLHQAYEITDILDFFAGKNIIIVSAGPSLEKNIHLLPEAKKKAIVIAVGTAIRILDARGITPHFRMSFDPFPAQYKLFSNLKDEPVPFIHTSALNAEVLPNYKGALIRFSTTNEPLSFLLHKRRNYQIISFRIGPSIANGAAEVFCAAGCKRMVFIGQDMCMYNHRVYTDIDDRSYENIQEKNLLHLKDINGNDVVSPRNHYMIKQYLEDTVARFSGKVEFINATEGGLRIYGVPNQPLADVLASWQEGSGAAAISEQLGKIGLIDFQDEFLELEKAIVTIDSLNDENLKYLQKIEDIFKQDVHLIHRGKYLQAFKAAQKNEQKLKEIDWYTDFIHKLVDGFLKAECMVWQNNIDSTDEKLKFRSILQIQLKTAQATKSITIIIKRALKDAFAAKPKLKAFSLNVK